ncbi:MAG: hypothetical protein L0Y56_18590 [Nitrospira sp.]|nr:hypothetical protein [Nitrospira sp.]
MRYLFLAVLLAMGMPFMAIAGPPSAQSMPSQAADGLNQAMENSGGVVGFNEDENELTITPNGEVGAPDDAGNPGSPFEGLLMPSQAAGGLSQAAGINDVISFTDNVLTVSPVGDVGGPGDVGNPNYGSDNHPGKP